MKIKIDPGTLKISFLEGDNLPGFYVGELIFDPGRPPILKISHPDHKTESRKSELKVVFEDTYIAIITSYLAKNEWFDEDLADILWPDGVRRLKMLINAVSKYLSEIVISYKDKKRLF